jgi:membrane protease YdiL (CAAX protease family)
MIGIIVILFASWLLLRLAAPGTGLSVLGLSPAFPRVFQLLRGLFLSLVLCVTYHLSTAWLSHNAWHVNPKYTAAAFFSGLWWLLKSVAFEELIFRGVLLYLAVRKMGIHKACILSAICFGIYHWFSFGALGNPVQMIFIFIMTAVAGLAFAYAFVRTSSLYLPIGLHYGWNLANIILFSKGPLGQQLLIPGNGNKAEGIVSLLLFLFQIASLPLATFLYLRPDKRKKAKGTREKNRR